MRIHVILLAGLLLAGLAMCVPGEEPQGARKVTADDVQKILASVSNWGRWGEDDELGTGSPINPIATY